MIVLDTHIWLWWIQQNAPALKHGWVDLIAAADQVGVSAISCFEVAWLARHDRIHLSEPLENWFDKALQGSGVDLLPVTPAIAQIAVELPEHHRDPQDRLIMATALHHQARLISADGKFPLYLEMQGVLIQ